MYICDGEMANGRVWLMRQCCLECGEVATLFFFLMIRRPPRSTQRRSSAASDVYKRQVGYRSHCHMGSDTTRPPGIPPGQRQSMGTRRPPSVSYTHLRAHETPEHLVCRLLLEKKKPISAALVYTSLTPYPLHYAKYTHPKFDPVSSMAYT